jgi:hypothetical protein
VAAIGLPSPGEITSILQADHCSVVATVTEFVATLIPPVTSAVGIGVALSPLLQLNRDAICLRLAYGSQEARPPRSVIRPLTYTFISSGGRI